MFEGGRRNRKNRNEKNFTPGRPITIARREDADADARGGGTAKPPEDQPQPRILQKPRDKEMNAPQVIQFKLATREKRESEVPQYPKSLTERDPSATPRLLGAISKNTAQPGSRGPQLKHRAPEESGRTCETSNLQSTFDLFTEEPPDKVMGKPVDLLNKNYHLNPSAFEHMMDINSDFLVFGVIGRKGTGKSTVINILAEPYTTEDIEKELLFDKKGIFRICADEMMYTTAPTTEGIKMYITPERNILLDSVPVMQNPYRKNIVYGELDDLKLLIFMMSVCHTLMLIEDNSPNLNLYRLIHIAEQMRLLHTQNDNCSHRPTIYFVKNHASRHDYEFKKEKDDQLYKTLFAKSKMRTLNALDDEIYEESAANRLLIPFINVDHPKRFTGTPTFNASAEELRNTILMAPRQRFKADKGNFTERCWAAHCTNIWESHRNNFFLRKDENMAIAENRVPEKHSDRDKHSEKHNRHGGGGSTTSRQKS